MIISRLSIAFIMMLCIISCSDQPAVKDAAPAETKAADNVEYDFSKPEVLSLKKKLLEISGITFLEEGKIAAVQDESGIIYILDERTGGVLETVEFAGKGDYEDIAVNAEYFFVLESSGIIYRVPRKQGSDIESYEVKGKKKKEFESLYLDGDKLVLLCKTCGRDDNLKDAYCFDLQKMEFESSGCLAIDLNAIINKLPAGTVLKPSAASINPLDKKLYVLCSIGKTLLQCTRDGIVERSFPLDEKLFRQPEGICFKPDGTMFISNEGAGGDATIAKISKSSFNK